MNLEHKELYTKYHIYQDIETFTLHTDTLLVYGQTSCDVDSKQQKLIFIQNRSTLLLNLCSGLGTIYSPLCPVTISRSLVKIHRAYWYEVST